MNKYVTPEAEIEKIESADVITVSGGVSLEALEGVDTEDSKSAVFNASFWINK